MTTLLKKDVRFEWGEKQENAFKELKTAIINAPILANPDPELPFTVVTDSSGFAIGAALCQNDGKGPRLIVKQCYFMYIQQLLCFYLIKLTFIFILYHFFSKFKIFNFQRYFHSLVSNVLFLFSQFNYSRIVTSNFFK